MPPIFAGYMVNIMRHTRGYISQLALPPPAGRYSLHAYFTASIKKHHNTAVTKIATQENSKGYINRVYRRGP
ncbi:MAG: hypothetical protein JWN56_1304 [Sphingobacteriales bacterium]|nr:hypothetical protein [Sphingobacteriales bacterium]